MADCIFNGRTKRPRMGLAEVTITVEDRELAEAGRFVVEGQTETQGINTELTEAGSTEGTEKTEEPSETSADGAAEAVSVAGDVAASGEEAAAEPEFVKGKRRKKAAEKLALAVKPGEVVVSRRLYRSGQSEYLINGRPGRLRDIQEMFMGVGLGPDSYAIIEQGRIGLILSTKPMERRAIIEEAAGVTKFKTKKRLAEAKLESSKVNLARVNDIFMEVAKQLV